MSSSRRRELRDVGVEVFDERTSRMFPSSFWKSRSVWGVRVGPSDFSLEGRMRMWS